jgi:hypothetical protein
MPIRTTKPLTAEELMAYRLAAAVKKFIDPGLGFRSIRMPPGDRREEAGLRPSGARLPRLH